MGVILRADGLTKRYGKFTAVDRLNLTVEEGDIYGFLGLNGAGKTTTIRMLLGLVRPTAGHVSIFTKDIRKHFLEIMRDIGALVEIPAFYPHLSAYQNLEILRLAGTNISRGRIDEALELVGLIRRKNDKVRAYSQGMRQRLGIAQALLSRPRLVILDEPLNGLDPQGISDIRKVIISLNKGDGVTFMISSHLLHEVEISATRVGMIRNGAMIGEDRVDRILKRPVNKVRLRGEPAVRTVDVLKGLSWIQGYTEEQDGTMTVAVDASWYARLNEELVRNSVQITEFSPLRLNLEEYFLSQ